MWQTSYLLLAVASYGIIHTDAAPLTTAAMAYASHAVAALEALQDFYDPSTGLWNTCGWWNAANCMTVVADLAAADTTSTTLNTAINVFATTFTQAPLVNPVAALSKISRPGFVLTTYDKPLSRLKERTDESAGFTDAYNDDNMWWALAWIAAYDLTRNASYLDTAIGLFDYNTNYGGPSYCNGGIYWADDNSYVNAIANELYLSAAAHIATRVDAASSAKYISIAQQQWQWFEASGMINAGYTINDGLTTSCENNNGTVWSYNQGVILGALVELNRAAPNATYLKIANKIALAAIAALTDSRQAPSFPLPPIPQLTRKSETSSTTPANPPAAPTAPSSKASSCVIYAPCTPCPRTQSTRRSSRRVRIVYGALTATLKTSLVLIGRVRLWGRRIVARRVRPWMLWLLRFMLGERFFYAGPGMGEGRCGVLVDNLLTCEVYAKGRVDSAITPF